MANPRFKIRLDAKAKKAEILLYDVIGRTWDGDGITAKLMKQKLDDAGDVEEILLRVNSPGGSAWEGAAIYNLLKDHSAKISVSIDGLAASAASMVILAGDEITIAPNAFIMIHNASGIVFGSAVEMRKTAAVLEKLDGQLAKLYASRGSRTAGEFAEMMTAETWFTASEAKDVGLADVIDDEEERPDAEQRFDLSRFGYTQVPAPLQEASRRPGRRSFASNSADRFAELNLDSLFSNANAGVSLMADTKKPAEAKPAESTPAAAAQVAATPPAGAPAAGNPPAQPTQPNLAAIQAEALKKANKRAGEIISLCAMAGCPQKAEEFINSDRKLRDIRSEIIGHFKSQNPPSTQAGASGGGSQNPPDENARFRAEFKANPHFGEQGLTEDEYVASRRIDLNLEPLLPDLTKRRRPAAKAEEKK
jgi:ATP-dependent protease ClpP protease subunit